MFYYKSESTFITLINELTCVWVIELKSYTVKLIYYQYSKSIGKRIKIGTKLIHCKCRILKCLLSRLAKSSYLFQGHTRFITLQCLHT